MDNTQATWLQEVRDGPLFQQLSNALWIDHGKDLIKAHVEGIDITHFDARNSADKDSWRTHLIPDLQAAEIVAMLGWGAGRGRSAMPRFRQVDVLRKLDSIRYDEDARAVLIALSSPHLLTWLGFVGKHVRPGTDVWIFGPGAPIRQSWEVGAHG